MFDRHRLVSRSCFALLMLMVRNKRTGELGNISASTMPDIAGAICNTKDFLPRMLNAFFESFELISGTWLFPAAG